MRASIESTQTQAVPVVHLCNRTPSATLAARFSGVLGW